MPRSSCDSFLYFPVNLDIDFRFEFPYIDEVRYGEFHVVEKIVEWTYKMQVLSEFLVKTFI